MLFAGINRHENTAFRQYNQNDELQPNQHSIPEPVNHAHVIHPERLDLVICAGCV